MSVLDTDVLCYKSQYMPTNDTSTAGGSKTSTEITGFTVGEVFPTTEANAYGGSSKIHYQKIFITNNNSSDDLLDTIVYLADSLNDLGSSGICSVVSSSASDNSSKKIKIIGFNASGSPQVEYITLNGLTPVAGSLTVSDVRRMEIRLASDNSLTTAAGDITLSVSSSPIGKIPATKSTATAELEIGLEPTLDDSNTTTNSITAPSGITFSKPNTSGTGILFANSGVLSATKGQGIWIKQTIKAGTQSSTQVSGILSVEGNS